jgi:hypothetical protein
MCCCCRKKRYSTKFANDIIAACIACTGTNEPIDTPILHANIVDDKYLRMRNALKIYQETSRPWKMFWHFFSPEEIEAIRHP